VSDELYVATSGAISRLTQLETVANNLANAGTVGFKADRAIFHTALESALLSAKQRPTPGAPGRAFVETQRVVTDQSAGTTSDTGNPLDVAIDGPGFFVVETPGGARYTRAGSFRLDANAQLVTLDGHPVLGEGGPIEVGTRPVRILHDGSIVDDRQQLLGRLRIEEFDDPGALVKQGANLFLAPARAVGIPSDNPTLIEHSVEGSNVQPVRELAVLMMLQRAFEANIQVMRSGDRNMERLIQEVSQ